MAAEHYFRHYVESNNDICQHLSTLRDYARGLDTVVELGVRSLVSTWAFLLARPKNLISVDIVHPAFYKEHDPMGGDTEIVFQEAKRLGVDFRFILGDSITVQLPECDLMFFDTLHTFKQLDAELKAHGERVNKYMIFHDTETFSEELKPAIRDFMMGHHEWSVAKVFTNNNGLMILEHE